MIVKPFDMYLPFKFIQNFKCLLPIIFKVSKRKDSCRICKNKDLLYSYV